MSSTGLILAVVIFLAGGAWLALPIVQGRRAAHAALDGAVAQKEREALVTAYERVLTTIRDLDEDYQIGKLPPEAYTAERARWTEQGAVLLETLEKRGQKPTAHRPAAKSVNAEAVLDDAIEQAIANYAKAVSRSQAGD